MISTKGLLMSDYSPPLNDMRFVLNHVVGLQHLPEHEDLGVLDIDMVDSVLEPAAKLASEVLAPINKSGDEQGAVLNNNIVKTADGFKEAYAQYRDGGWNAVPFSSKYGGQELPWLVAFPLQEMWQGANMSFGLCPLLNQGAVEAIEKHGSQEQKDFYLEKLISGEWTGTMNLTEPQAGSDLSAIRTKAEPDNEGQYRIFGQKIYITYGEHDMAENIIHLVLARLPNAPEGVKGISLFSVPKFLSDGTRNDVQCTGLEHKLGIHASPTCTMQFGDDAGAVGYLIGEENQGLKCMFTMMNNARLSVGLQGVAIAERSYQQAIIYAKDREQGTSLSDKSTRVAIIEHADVKRMLMGMKAQIEAMRALTYEAALQLDLAANGNERARAKADLLTPIVKSFGTDMAVEVTSTGVQIHGGMGFVEETGAAQHYRDARILPIYEGTNGIQSLDLLFRKIMRDQGEALKEFFKEGFEVVNLLKSTNSKNLMLIEDSLNSALKTVQKSALQLSSRTLENPDSGSALSMPFLNMMGTLAGGVMMGRSALKANELLEFGEDNKEFLQSKINTAEFYSTHILVRVYSYEGTISGGDDSVLRAKL